MTVSALRSVAEGNAEKLSEAIDGFALKALSVYTELAERALEPGVGKALASGIHTVLEEARRWGHVAGAGDVLDELKAIAPKARLNLSASGPPTRSTVDGYVQSAVDEATSKAQAAADSDFGQAFIDASYRAVVLIEDQVVREYERSKAAAYNDLERLDDNPDRGFLVARDAGQLRSIRADSAVAMVAKRRSEVNDARTCNVCRQEDGQLRLLGQTFTAPIPAHPRCRGISHLWAVGWPWEDESKAMSDILTRWVSTIDIRAVQIDEAARTIRNVVVSDETVDSHDSIIRAAGWDFARYAKNPVLLWAHSGARGLDAPDPEDVLGQAQNVRVDGTRVLADFVFFKKGLNPRADLVFDEMVEGGLRGVSVGFKEREYHFEKRDGGGEILIIDSAMLVEISVLPVGSNENALARAFRAAQCGSDTENNMSTKQTEVAQAATVALPPELASVTGAATIEAAVRRYEEQAQHVAELELKLDKATKDAEAATTRAVAAEKTIADRIESETVAEVDALIKVGRISEEKRTFALNLARKDFEAFRGLYPVEPIAPLAPMLRQITKETPAETQVQTQVENPIVKRAAELIAGGAEYTAAWNQAIKESHNAAV